MHVGARKMTKIFRLYNDVAGLHHPELISRVSVGNDVEGVRERVV